jgi:hypothetical protein
VIIRSCNVASIKDGRFTLKLFANIHLGALSGNSYALRIAI